MFRLFAGNFLRNIYTSLVLGILFIFAAFHMLWTNEHLAALNQTQAAYINKYATTITSDYPDRENDNKLVITSGKLFTDENLSDENIMVRKALVLDRKVQMYQWKEVRENAGRHRNYYTYTYKMDWVDFDSKQDWNNFHDKKGHENPDFPIASLRLNAPKGVLGGFFATELQTANLKNLSSIENLPQSNLYQVVDGAYYSKGTDVDKPKLGDLKITYAYVPSGIEISVVGQQNPNNTISEAKTKAGIIYLQGSGVLDKAQILKDFQFSSKLWVNIDRFLGFLMMILGFNFLSRPLRRFFDVIPFVNIATDALSAFVNTIIATALSMATIAVAWLFFRPAMGILMLIVAGITLYFVYTRIYGVPVQKRNIFEDAVLPTKEDGTFR